MWIILVGRVHLLNVDLMRKFASKALVATYAQYVLMLVLAKAIKMPCFSLGLSRSIKFVPLENYSDHKSSLERQAVTAPHSNALHLCL